MPYTSLVVGAALVAQVHASVAWGLAGAGQSCTAYCNQQNQACTPGHWPTDAYQMLRVAIAVDRTECTNVKLSKDVHAPSVTAGTDTDCHYNLEVGSSAPSCAQAPPAGTQRFCPCSDMGLRWYLASEGQSCTDACRVKGGICGDEASVWPNTEDSLANVMSYVGASCSKHEAGSAAFNPSVSSDGTCHWGSTAAGQTAFCAAADWTNSHQKRVCPCWDAA